MRNTLISMHTCAGKEVKYVYGFILSVTLIWLSIEKGVLWGTLSTVTQMERIGGKQRALLALKQPNVICFVNFQRRLSFFI